MNSSAIKQKGAVLLIIFLVIFSVGSTLLLASLNSRSPYLQREVIILEEMALAKESLLTYAFSYPELYSAPNGPGRLPCTDSNNDGSEDCLSQGARLPTNITLANGSINQLANIDRQLWYFIAPAFDPRSGTPINTTTPAGFTVDGEADIVAVLIAPGAELSWQNRSAGPASATNYLEAGNQTGNNFINNYPLDPANFNDHVLGITRSEVMSLATIKVAQEIKQTMDDYHQNFGLNAYPLDALIFSTEMAGAPLWFDNDDWDLVTNYTYVSDDIATFTFNNCAITFTLNAGSNLSLNPKDC